LSAASAWLGSIQAVAAVATSEAVISARRARLTEGVFLSNIFSLLAFRAHYGPCGRWRNLSPEMPGDGEVNSGCTAGILH